MAEHHGGSFEFIDHTADAGIKVEAPTLENLFETAGLAFTELVTSVDSVNCRVERRFNLEEDDIETLLRSSSISWIPRTLFLVAFR
jgi:SHS2 domain-containing protein